MSAAQDWLQGQAAAVFGGSDFAQQVLHSRISPEAVALLPAPGWGPRPANAPTRCKGLVVTADATREPAWTLVEWLALGEPASERCSLGLGLPASRERLDWKSISSMPQWITAVQQELEQAQVEPLLANLKLDLTRASEVWNRQEESFLVGEIGLDEMIAKMEEKWDTD
jgi:hypothetical protein